MTLSQYISNLVTFFFQLFVVFPYSALTIPRQRPLQPRNPQPAITEGDATAPRPSDSATPPSSSPSASSSPSSTKPANMISEKVYKLCTSPESVSALLAENPKLEPGDAYKKLYGGHSGGESKATAKAHRDTITPEDLKRAAECGKWGPTQPSDLFLRIYHDALCTLDKSVGNAMVSPSLMGSAGVIPLTVISVVPEIMKHMSNVIVRAEKEVYLATNYWQNSVASRYITNAMKELSRRAGERGEKIVFKLIYDRGSPKQLLEPHYFVPEKEYLGKAVALPRPEEIPNLDLQVMNYHQALLGTFHCKYMIVDRKIGILQSNNIQDNDNVEMMIHLEGPIVDSLYDMALISWHKKLDPPLPSHNSPAVQGGLGSFGNKTHEEIFDPNGAIKGHSVPIHPGKIADRKAYAYEPHAVNQPGVIPPQENDTSDTNRTDVVTGPSTTDSILHPVDNQTSVDKYPEQQQTGPGEGTLVNTGGPTGTTEGHAPGADSKTEEFLHSGEQSIPYSQIEHPSPEGNLLPEHTADDPHYDVDIAGEVARVQTAYSPKPGESRVQAVARQLNHTKNKGFVGDVAPDCAPHEEMTPYLPHPVHEPFPIAMVCRPPYGPPNHHSVYNPQNEAWLSALRNAQKNVFIQSPTLNAEPLVPAIIEACERGIDVYCYICLGYNDTGELLPMQGGTNEMIAHKMYTTLSAEAKKRLHYFWYIGKDQTRPIVAKKKKRSCHVKLMIVDEHIGIQGNGNQDTQSWFHSQEINVMIDSAYVCKAWIDGLRRNQNTHLYGQLSQEDGIWRDPSGNQADDVIGINPGKFSWAKGFLGAVERVRGTGDF